MPLLTMDQVRAIVKWPDQACPNAPHIPIVKRAPRDPRVCKRGHPRTPENTVKRKNGGACRLCIRYRAYARQGREEGVWTEDHVRALQPPVKGPKYATAPIGTPLRYVTPTGRLSRKRQNMAKHYRRTRPFLPGAAHLLSDPCVYCAGPAKQLDHIEPLYRGGLHQCDNLARVCWDCNRTKNTQRLLLFLARRAVKRQQRDSEAEPCLT